MKRSILRIGSMMTLCVVLLAALSLTGLAQGRSRDANGATWYDDSGQGGYTNDSIGTSAQYRSRAAGDPLPAPAYAEWGPNGEAVFGAVDGAEGSYYLTLFQDNKKIYSTNLYDFYPVGGNITFNRVTVDLYYSGTYHYTVAAVGPDGETLGEVATSPDLVYTRPADSLSAPTNLRWEVDEADGFRACWDAPADFREGDTYCVRVSMKSLDGEEFQFLMTYNVKKTTVTYDAEHISEPGTYTFTVQTISGDIWSRAHSGVTAPSPGFDLADRYEAIRAIVYDIMGRLYSGEISTIQAMTELKAVNTSELAAAMQGDWYIRNYVDDLERTYQAENGVSVVGTVNPAVAQRLGEGDISVLGGALNAQDPATPVSLEFTLPDEEVVVDASQYKNWVQFEISMEGVADTQKLDFPVRITMPIPVGVLPERLAILHYHANGEYEVIDPILNDDGTCSFTVTRFSVFVFANERDGDEPGDGIIPGDLSGDGAVDARDVRLLKQAVARIITLTPAQQAAADVTGDGVVDARDARKLSQYVARIISSL